MTLSPITRLALYGIAAILLSQATLLNSYVANQINQLPILGQRSCSSAPSATPSSTCPEPADTSAQLNELLKNLSPIYVPITKQKPTLASTSNIDPTFEQPIEQPQTLPPSVAIPDQLPPDLQLQATMPPSSYSSKKAAIINNSAYSQGDTVFILNNIPWVLSNVSESTATISPLKTPSTTKTTPKQPAITLFLN